MSRLPTVGGDNDGWGSVLNDYLLVSHNADGTIKNSANLKTINSESIIGSGNISITESTKRVNTITTNSTLELDTDNYEITNVTTLATDLTITGFAGVSATEGLKHVLMIKDNGTRRTLSFSSIPTVNGITLPTQTTANTMRFEFECLGVAKVWTCVGYFDQNNIIVSASTTLLIDETHIGKIIECNGTFTVTFPNSLVSGAKIDVVNVGTGIITLAASTTLQTKSSYTKLASQYGGASVYHRGSNIWLAVGDLTA